MKNPNPPNEPNKAIPEENPVIPDLNQVVDVHDPNEMVDITNSVDLVDYDGDDEENTEEDPKEDLKEDPEEDPKEDPEEEPEPNNGLVNQFSPHVDLHQPGVMIEPPNEESSDYISSDSKSEEKEADEIPSSAHDSSYVGGLAPWALRRKKREREILDHDLGNVEKTLSNVVERLKVLESRENATSKKKLVEAEMKLELARMEHDMLERRLHASYGWNKRFYMEMVRIGAVPKPPSDDEGTERPRKKSRKSFFDGTEGPFEPRGPPSDS
ncbi:hypothetical protein Tco_1147986 [Tanacetum coccineum]